MRLLYFVVVLGLPVCGLAQGIVFGGGAGGVGTSSVSGDILLPGRTVGIGNLSVTLRTDPPATAVGTPSSYRGHSSNGVPFFSRIVLDAAKHQYSGYEVTLEPQQSGTYLATFGKLGITPMEAAVEAGSTAKDWSLREVALPQPKVVQVGDTLSIEFGVHPTTGAKLIDDIQIQPQRQRPALGALGYRAPASVLNTAPNLPALARATPATPAVSTADGTARDFTAGDAEMQVRQPRITLNGQQQPTTGRTPAIVTGTLVWFYLPGRGRYVLSLAPRPELNFQKAGELRGGSIKFTLGEDTIALECLNEIAPGHAPYNLYVLLDSQWEPTANGQKGQFAIGSVDAGELAKLKRQ